MKIENTSECKVQVLVCTNERAPGKVDCFKNGGQDFYLKLKNKLKETGLYATHWVTRTGCLGFCPEVGTTVAIYARGKEPVFYTEVTDKDADTIWELIVRE